MQRIALWRLLPVLAVPLGSSDSSGEEVSNRLLTMNEQARHAALTENIKPNGQPCDAVIRSIYVEKLADESARWSVEWQDKNSYSLTIFSCSRQFTLVTGCEDLKSVSAGVIECWRK